MNKRRTILIGLAIVSVLALAVYDGATHVIRGTLRGEAFFDGRPTSWWRGVVLNALESPKLIWWNPFRQRLVWDPDNQIARELGQSEDAEAVLENLANDMHPKVSAIASDLLLVIRGQSVRSYSEVWNMLLQKHRIR